MLYVCSLCSEEDEIKRSISLLDDVLDLFDADDDDADLYRSSQLLGDDSSSSHLLPLSCAKTAVRNIEIRKSRTAG